MTKELRSSALEIVVAEGFLWGNDVAISYFDAAERDMAHHWEEVIAPFLGDIRYHVAVDLASGRGRNAEFLAREAEQVICVELNPDNISALRQRFRGRDAFTIVQNDGVSLGGVSSGGVDLVYCYDAMVHFDLEIIQMYLREIMRVLVPGGHAFLHCSNYTQNPGGDFRANPHWRNFCSAEMLSHLAQRAGLRVLKLDRTPWGGIAALDCMVLLQRPA